jgi:hypothetical protein
MESKRSTFFAFGRVVLPANILILTGRVASSSVTRPGADQWQKNVWSVKYSLHLIELFLCVQIINPGVIFMFCDHKTYPGVGFWHDDPFYAN